MRLWRRRIQCVRPAKVFGAGRIRRAPGAVLYGRHRPWISGVEAGLESALSAEERGVSRASRDDRKAVLCWGNRSGAEEEFRAVLLEEHPRVAPAWIALLLRLRGRGGDGAVRRFTGAREFRGIVEGTPPIAGGDAITRTRSSNGYHQRHGGISPAIGRLLPRSVYAAGTAC